MYQSSRLPPSTGTSYLRSRTPRALHDDTESRRPHSTRGASEAATIMGVRRSLWSRNRLPLSCGTPRRVGCVLSGFRLSSASKGAQRSRRSRRYGPRPPRSSTWDRHESWKERSSTGDGYRSSRLHLGSCVRSHGTLHGSRRLGVPGCPRRTSHGCRAHGGTLTLSECHGGFSSLSSGTPQPRVHTCRSPRDPLSLGPSGASSQAFRVHRGAGPKSENDILSGSAPRRW